LLINLSFTTHYRVSDTIQYTGATDTALMNIFQANIGQPDALLFSVSSHPYPDHTCRPKFFIPRWQFAWYPAHTLTAIPQTKDVHAQASVVTLPSLSVIYLSLRDKHAALITQVSSPSLHELMSTNIRSFHAHFSIGTRCLLKSVSSTRCL